MSDFVRIRVTYQSQETAPGGAPDAGGGPGAATGRKVADSFRRLNLPAVAVAGALVLGGAIGAGLLFTGGSDPSSPGPAVAEANSDPAEEIAMSAVPAEPAPVPTNSADEAAVQDDEPAGNGNGAAASVARFETGGSASTNVVAPPPVQTALSPEPADEAGRIAMMPLPVKKPAAMASASRPAAAADEAVARSQLTSAMRGREPVDRLAPRVTIGEDGRRKLFYFTELKGLNGETVLHRWEHDGRTMVTLRFNVGSDRWRGYSSKTIPADQTGDWRVVVANAEGDVLASSRFVVE